MILVIIKTVSEMVKENQTLTAMRAYYILLKRYGIRYTKQSNVYDLEVQRLHRLADKQNENWAQITVNAYAYVDFAETNKSLINKTCAAKRQAK